MNQITDPPNTYDFGLDFNYAAWNANTVITLANVPWNSDYRDVVRFNTPFAPQTLDEYIDSMQTVNTRVPNVSYVNAEMPVRLDVPINKALQYNYLRASNGSQPIPGDTLKNYYYFITGVRRIAPNTTEFTIQLDVWQTYIYNVHLGNCYIERGHIGMANSNSWSNYGRDYLTIPEGLDVGGEYKIAASRGLKIATPNYGPNGNIPGYDILVCSTTDLLADPGDTANPKLVSASGALFSNIPSGANYYIFAGATKFTSWMNDHKDKPWQTQGIISITLIPRINRYISNWDYTPFAGHDDIGPVPGQTPPTLTHILYQNWREAAEISNQIPLKYRSLRKFYTYPYMLIEMTTFGGTPIIIKPESWAEQDAVIAERAALIPPNQRVIFWPRRYNAPAPTTPIDNRGPDSWWPTIPGVFQPVDQGLGNDGGEYLDFFTMINNFPTMAIVNNGALGYMAANAHSIAFTTSSADYTRLRAGQSTRATYDNARTGMELASELANSGMSADRMSTYYSNQQIGDSQLASGVSTVISGAAGGATAGPAGAAIGAGMGGIGAIAGAVQAGIQTGTNNSQLANRNISSQRNLNAGQSASQQVANTNKALSQWAAQGDYEQTIAGLQARVQDAQLTQPSTSGQTGGETMNLIHNEMGVRLNWKMINPGAMRAIGDYWLRYGYSVRQFGRIPDDFMAMTKFTYWKLAETYISQAPMPETFKQVIRGIFEKGVTVWRYPADIGNIALEDNQTLTGITL